MSLEKRAGNLHTGHLFRRLDSRCLRGFPLKSTFRDKLPRVKHLDLLNTQPERRRIWDKLPRVKHPDSLNTQPQRRRIWDNLPRVKHPDSQDPAPQTNRMWVKHPRVKHPDSLNTQPQRRRIWDKLPGVKHPDSQDPAPQTNRMWVKHPRVKHPDSLNTLPQRRRMWVKHPRVKHPDSLNTLPQRRRIWDKLPRVKHPDSLNTQPERRRIWDKLPGVKHPDSQDPAPQTNRMWVKHPRVKHPDSLNTLPQRRRMWVKHPRVKHPDSLNTLPQRRRIWDKLPRVKHPDSLNTQPERRRIWDKLPRVKQPDSNQSATLAIPPALSSGGFEKDSEAVVRRTSPPNAAKNTIRDELMLSDAMLFNDTVGIVAQKVIEHKGLNEGTYLLMKPVSWNVVEEAYRRHGSARILNVNAPMTPNPDGVFHPKELIEMNATEVEQVENVYFMVHDYHSRLHFYFAHYSKRTEKVVVVDSINAPRAKYTWVIQVIESILTALSLSFREVEYAKCAKQSDGVSCGIFAIKFLECQLNGTSYAFRKFDIQSYRSYLSNIVQVALPNEQVEVTKDAGNEEPVNCDTVSSPSNLRGEKRQESEIDVSNISVYVPVAKKSRKRSIAPVIPNRARSNSRVTILKPTSVDREDDDAVEQICENLCAADWKCLEEANNDYRLTSNVLELFLKTLFVGREDTCVLPLTVWKVNEKSVPLPDKKKCTRVLIIYEKDGILALIVVDRKSRKGEIVCPSCRILPTDLRKRIATKCSDLNLGRVRLHAFDCPNNIEYESSFSGLFICAYASCIASNTPIQIGSAIEIRASIRAQLCRVENLQYIGWETSCQSQTNRNEDRREYYREHKKSRRSVLSPTRRSQIAQVNASQHRNVYDRRLKPGSRRNALHKAHVLEALVECVHCGSLNFPKENPGICCSNGTIFVENFSMEVDPVMLWFKQLLLLDQADSKKFLKNARNFNTFLAFGSTSMNLLTSKDVGPGAPVPLLVEGKYTVNTCSLLPIDSSRIAFAQLYYSTEETVMEQYDKASATFKWDDACKKVFRMIHRILCDNNDYARAYKTMKEVLDERMAKVADGTLKEMPHIFMSLMNVRDVPRDQQGLMAGEHPGTLNQPVATDSVFTIYSSENGPLDYGAVEKGTYVFDRHSRTRKATDIPAFANARDALMYPILFPKGNFTFVPGMKKRMQGSKFKRETISRREFARFVLRHVKPMDKHWLYGYGKLVQQFVIDYQTRIESDEFSMMRKRQAAFAKRCTTENMYTRFLEQKLNDKGISLGNVVQLNSHYPGSRAFCDKNYHNSMAIARRIGRPTLFITFTGNPMWPEIQENLLPNQTFNDDSVLVARVFREKLQHFMKVVMDKGFFGKVTAYVISIEFQKRNMPHAHILLTLEESLDTAEKIDDLISAEIPILPYPSDPTYADKKRLRDLVRTHMVHGPCEHRTDLTCRREFAGRQQCQKNYPMAFCETTQMSDDRYPTYKRPDNGQKFVYGSGLNERVATNRHVVPHSPQLLAMFECHINVEVLENVTCFRYINKYVYKGMDKAIVEVTKNIERDNSEHLRQKDGQIYFDYDETKIYVAARVMGPMEAAWRLYSFPLSYMSHVVSELHVHLTGENPVIIETNDDDEAITEKLSNNKSKFMAYMALCATDTATEDGQLLREMLWVEADENCRFVKGKYVPYKRTQKKISRVVPVSPADPERYALYVMALKVPGFTSMEHLLTADDGTVYDSLMQAARGKGFIIDSEEWDRCLTEAAHNAMPRQMRVLFATILMLRTDTPPDAKKLWEKFKSFMINPDRNNVRSTEERELLALAHIQSIIRHQGMTMTDVQLPVVDDAVLEAITNDQQVRECANIAAQMSGSLNRGQRMIVEAVLNAVNDRDEKERLFFLEGSGGCGKTFTYNYLTNLCIGEKKKVLVCASSGIAATLLKNGRTVHSTFRAPLIMHGEEEARIDATSRFGRELLDADLIIWDEAPMQSKHLLEYVDKLMRNIASADRANLSFGGTVVLLGGDWKQTLCVIEGIADRAICDYTLKRSRLWPQFKTLRLTENMRVNVAEVQFAEWLTEVGEGRNLLMDGLHIRLPNEMVAKSAHEIIDFVYPQNVLKQTQEMIGRAILTVTNAQSLQLNDRILEKLQGELVSIAGSTEAVEDAEESLPPQNIEDLEKITPSGMPPHILKLKIGAPVMLLRNLNLKEGLCNGTRLIVEGFRTDVNGRVCILVCRNITASINAVWVFIPRITLKFEDKRTSVGFKRRQFPVRLSFAMTVNKSQGQTLSKVGLLFDSPVFTHGQLYVAVSRVRSIQDLRVFSPYGLRQEKDDDGSEVNIMRNVVYREIL